MVRNTLRVCLPFASGWATYPILQTRPRSSQRTIKCRRPDCRRKFVTIAGRARHLDVDEICKLWWKDKMDNLRSTQNYSSSEISSGEDSDYCPVDSCIVNDMPMDMDVDVDRGLEDDPSRGFREGSPAGDFTFSPSGIDIETSEPIDVSGSSTFVEEYLHAAEIIEKRENLYTQIWDADELHGSRKIGGSYYPFSGCLEWEMVEWLHSLNAPIDQIDRFFNLGYVSSTVIFATQISRICLGQVQAVFLFLGAGNARSY